MEWVLECDSTLTGGGAYSRSHFYGIAYGTEILDKKLGIARLEALNLVLALKTLLPGKPHELCVVINTDNAASQQVLEEGRG